MDILITCHRHPDIAETAYGRHPNLSVLNKNTREINNSKNTTRKNKSSKKVSNKRISPHRIYYIDTDPDIPDIVPSNFFNKWNDIPKESMDIIWGHYCPAYYPFNHSSMENITGDEQSKVHLLSSERSHAFWSIILKHGLRVLKEEGKFVFPFIPSDNFLTHDNEILLAARIINMECFPEYIFKMNVVTPGSATHKELLNGLLIYEKEGDEPMPTRLLIISLGK